MENNELKRLMLVLGLMLFFLQGDNYATAPLLVDLANDFNITAGKATLLVTAYMIPFGLFTLLFGPLGDRVGKGRILKVSALLTAFFSFLSAIMADFNLVCFVRVFNGLFAAGVMPVSMALIGEKAGNDPVVLHSSLSKTMGLMFLGGAVGPTLGGWLSQFGGWRFVFGFYGCIEFILALMIILLIPSTKPAKQQGSFLLAYRDTIKIPEVIKTVPILFIIGMAVMGSYPFTGNYMKSVSQLPISTIGMLLTLFGVGAVIGGRLSQKTFSKLKQAHFIVAGVTGGVCLAVLSITGHPILIGGLLMLFGLSFMLIQPLLVARAQQASPTRRGTVMSLASFNMAFGGGIGTVVLGVLFKTQGYPAVFITGGILFCVAGLIAWLASPKASGLTSASVSRMALKKT